MAKPTRLKANRRSRNRATDRGCCCFEVVLYKVAKQNLSDQAEDHAASCGGTIPTANGKRNQKEEEQGGGRNKRSMMRERERDHNRMIEVVCEGRRFGDRTNENARDWLWVVLVVRAAKSINSLFAGQDLGSDSTFLPHGSDDGDLRRDTQTTCSSQSSETLHVSPSSPSPPSAPGSGLPTPPASSYMGVCL